MKKRALALMICLIALSLCGCNRGGLENQLLVIIIGVDKEEKGVHVSVKVPSNAGAQAKEAESGGEQKGYLLLEADGKDFIEAISVLNAATPRTLNFSQTREIVIAEKAAGDGDFMKTLEAIYALPRIRNHAKVIICKGKAKEFVDAQSPYLGVRLSTYIETSLENYEVKGFIPSTTLFEAYRDCAYGYIDPLLIVGAVNDFKNKQDESVKQPENVIAGEMPRKSVNAVEMLGAAMTDGMGVSGTLTGYEMALINLIFGSIQALEVPIGEGYVTVSPRASATLSADLSGARALLSVDLTLDMNRAPKGGVGEKEVADLVQKDMKKVIKKMQTARCDGVGFGNIAVRSYSTIADWNQVNWRETYESADVRVRVKVQATAR